MQGWWWITKAHKNLAAGLHMHTIMTITTAHYEQWQSKTIIVTKIRWLGLQVVYVDD